MWSDHVALPVLVAFPRVCGPFAERGVIEDLVWVGSGRLDRDVVSLAKEPHQLAQGAGRAPPGLVEPDQLEVIDGRLQGRPVREVVRHAPGWGLPGADARAAIRALVDGAA